MTTFSIIALELGQMENFIYLIGDHDSQHVAVIDPAWEVSKILVHQSTVCQKGKITDILLTHSHYDHANGVRELLARTGAQLHLLKAEADFWGAWGRLDPPTLHQDGDVISLGKTAIRCLHTPGHTPGSTCYYLDGHLITGDTLFVYGCGRCDLPGGDAEQMYHSLQRLSRDLPPQTVIHPGHHYGITPTSTLAEQLAGNPFLHFNDPAAFAHYRLYEHNRETPYTAVKK